VISINGCVTALTVPEAELVYGTILFAADRRQNGLGGGKLSLVLDATSIYEPRTH
jgi:hypothetical protein